MLQALIRISTTQDPAEKRCHQTTPHTVGREKEEPSTESAAPDQHTTFHLFWGHPRLLSAASAAVLTDSAGLGAKVTLVGQRRERWTSAEKVTMRCLSAKSEGAPAMAPNSQPLQSLRCGGGCRGSQTPSADIIRAHGHVHERESKCGSAYSPKCRRRVSGARVCQGSGSGSTIAATRILSIATRRPSYRSCRPCTGTSLEDQPRARGDALPVTAFMLNDGSYFMLNDGSYAIVVLPRPKPTAPISGMTPDETTWSPRSQPLPTAHDELVELCAAACLPARVGWSAAACPPARVGWSAAGTPLSQRLSLMSQ
eukprot:2567375-Prymnesium_polylepis.1